MSNRGFPNRVQRRRVICGERLEDEIASRDRVGSTLRAEVIRRY